VEAKWGQPEFFEFLLQNTFAETVICLVSMSTDTNRLRLITDSAEWKHWKARHNLKSPLERDLLRPEESSGQPTLLLNPMESVYIPFIYDPFTTPTGDAAEVGEESHELRVVFTRIDSGEPIAILEVLAHVRGHAASVSHRWISEAHSTLERTIPLHHAGILSSSRVLNARSLDPSVACTIRTEPGGVQSLAIKCHTGGANEVRSFLVALYTDRWRTECVSVWHFTLHCMEKVNIEAVRGQSTRIHLPMGELVRRMRDESADGHSGRQRLLQFHSSNLLDVAIHPAQPFSLTSTHVLTNELQLALRPSFTGRAVFQVTATEPPSSDSMSFVARLLCTWLVSVSVREPNIVKSYELTVPLQTTTPAVKKIAFANPYALQRTFRVTSSDASVLAVKDEYFTLEANGSEEVELVFRTLSKEGQQIPGVVQLLLYVENVDTGQHEEAYSLRIAYV